MANVLSQEEVDSLLEGIDEERFKPRPLFPESEEGLEAYNFGAQVGPVHLRMPTLGIY